MKFIRFFAFVPIAAMLLSGCENGDDGWSDVPNTSVRPISQKNKVIYQINVYSFSATSDFKGVENALSNLQELGVDILYLMPIHPIGETNRQGTLGSPYAVRDYRAVNPDFGNKEDFRSLIEAAHARGMELWLDWVANHTAWDNIWVDTHIEYYATSMDGKRPYSPSGWNDAIQLDHTNSGLLDAMAGDMKYWIDEFGVNGFRCDAADLVPLDFWRGLREKVDPTGKTTWLAEGWDEKYMEVFDCNYAWAFSESLEKFGRDGDVAELVKACRALHKDPVYKDKSRMVYLANHDLNAYDGTEFTRYPNNVLPLTVLMYTIYDLPMVFNGQEVGMNKSINFSELQYVDWVPANKIFVNLHKKMTQLKRTNPALEDGTNRGSLKIYPTSNENLFAYSRVRGNNEVLMILNFGSYATQCRFTGEIPSGKFKNWLENSYHEFSADGIPVREHGYTVFVK